MGNPTQQITAHVFDVIRAELPNLELDEVFEAKETLALAVKNALSATMGQYGDKILKVKSAEAEAEAKYLSGVGVAKQRKAIVDGLRESITEFSSVSKGTSSKDIMDLLLLTQYFDCIKDVGSAPNCKTTFVPCSKSIGDDLRTSLIQAEAAK